MIDEALTALASAAGTTLAAAMATDAWQTARSRIGRLFGRRAEADRAAFESQLDRHEALVQRAEQPDHVRQRLASSWRAELETMLEDDPGLADELRAAVAAIDGELRPDQRSWVRHIVQHVTVSGSGNLTNVVAGGNVIQHPDGVPSPPRRD